MRFGLKTRISIVIVSLMSALALIIAGGSLWQFRASMQTLNVENIETTGEALREEMLLRATTMAAGLAENLLTPLLLNNIDHVGSLLTTTLHDADVLSAQVYDHAGMLIHDGRSSEPGDNTVKRQIVVPGFHPMHSIVRKINDEKTSVSIRHPILKRGDVIGGVKLNMSLSRVNTGLSAIGAKQKRILEKGFDRLLIINITSTLGLLSLAIIVSLLFARFLSRPLEILADNAAKIGRGDFTVQKPAEAGPEIETLASALSNMARNIKSSNEKIRNLAYNDSLTGMPNRLQFKQALGEVLIRAKSHSTSFAVLFLDMDNFKRVNDAMGHRAGDQLLIEISRRISACLYVHKNERVLDDAAGALLAARLGGDEFVVVLGNVSDKRMPLRVAEQILQTLASPLSIGNQSLYVTASIGITVFPDDGKSVDALLKNADIAMYEAKRVGPNVCRFYRPDLQTPIARSLEIETRLRSALSGRELFLVFQPVQDVETRKIVSLEALLRWRMPNGEVIAPAEFLPVAESSGLILPIADWVMDEACAQIARWRDAGYETCPVAINLSQTQFLQPGLREKLLESASKNGVSPRDLILEITEAALMADLETVFNILSTFKTLGIKIAMDDFGVAYSSLSRLQQLPVDIIKIDKSFVQRAFDEGSHDDQKRTRDLLSVMIKMGHTLNKTVLAEGVETSEQLDLLKRYRCDLAQGNLISEPVNANQISGLLPLQRLSA